MLRSTLLIFFLAATVNLGAQTQDEYFTLPKKYTIAYTQLNGPQAFSKRWISLVRERLTVIKEHILTDREKESIYQNVRSITIVTQGKKLSEVQEDLAKIQLKQASQEKGQSYKLFLEQERLKGLIKKLKKQDMPKLPDTMPLEVKEENSSYLNDMAFYDPQTYLWIYGQAAELNNGVYYLEYYAFNSLTNQRYVLLQQTLNETKIFDAVETAVGRLRTLILGRTWGALKISSTSASTQYYLNGKEVVDPRMLDILAPGKYTLKAITPGYKSEELEINITSGTVAKANFQPILLPNSLRLIESRPTGATVYLDGEHVGQTPLKVNAGTGQILYLHLPEYQPVFFTMNDKSQLLFSLVSNDTNIEKKIEDAQTLFYASLGIFVTSLIAPIALYTMQRNAYDKANILTAQGNLGAAQASLENAQVYGIAFWSTTGVSAGLLGWTIYQLVHYVRTSTQKE